MGVCGSSRRRLNTKPIIKPQLSRKGVGKELKQKKIQIPMSLVFAKEECAQALLDFLFHTDVGRVSGGGKLRA